MALGTQILARSRRPGDCLVSRIHAVFVVVARHARSPYLLNRPIPRAANSFQTGNNGYHFVNFHKLDEQQIADIAMQTSIRQVADERANLPQLNPLWP